MGAPLLDKEVRRDRKRKEILGTDFAEYFLLLVAHSQFRPLVRGGRRGL